MEVKSTEADEMVPSETRHIHQDSDSSTGSHHLMVAGLYDDETQQRKSSISFDKIKQISLTYSLQSEDEAGQGDLPLGGPKCNNDESGEEHRGSFEGSCNGPQGLETSIEVPRQVKLSGKREFEQIAQGLERLCDTNGAPGKLTTAGGQTVPNATHAVYENGVNFGRPIYPQTNPFCEDSLWTTYDNMRDYGRTKYKTTNPSTRDENADYNHRIGDQMYNQRQYRGSHEADHEQAALIARGKVTKPLYGTKLDDECSFELINNGNKASTRVGVGYSPRRKQLPREQPFETSPYLNRAPEPDGWPALSANSLSQSSASSGLVGAGQSTGLRVSQSKGSISLVVLNETDTKIVISDQLDSDDSYGDSSVSQAVGPRLGQRGTSGTIDLSSGDDPENGYEIGFRANTNNQIAIQPVRGCLETRDENFSANRANRQRRTPTTVLGGIENLGSRQENHQAENFDPQHRDPQQAKSGAIMRTSSHARNSNADHTDRFLRQSGDANSTSSDRLNGASLQQLVSYRQQFVSNNGQDDDGSHMNNQELEYGGQSLYAKSSSDLMMEADSAESCRNLIGSSSPANFRASGQQAEEEARAFDECQAQAATNDLHSLAR